MLRAKNQNYTENLVQYIFLVLIHLHDSFIMELSLKYLHLKSTAI